VGGWVVEGGLAERGAFLERTVSQKKNLQQQVFLFVVVLA